MQILETHAKNEKEALQISAEYLETSEENLTVELVKKGEGGFLGMGSKSPSVYNVFAVPSKTPIQIVIKGILATVLHKMGYKVKFVKFETLEDGKIYVEMASPNAGYIIGKKGKTLESLQFLTNVMLEKFTKDAPKVLLDIEKYRSRRENFLASMAKKMAHQVLKSRRSRLLLPLNPYERRIVHMHLQEMENIQTESEGHGVYKRVRIMYTGPAAESHGNSRNHDNHGQHENHDHGMNSDEEAMDDFDHQNLESAQASMHQEESQNS